MNKYILRRIAIAIPLILAIMTIVFVMLRVAVPGDPALLLAGDRASPELIEQIRESLGLNRPLWEQYLIFLRNAALGDMGISIMHRQPVLSIIFSAFPFTVAVTFYSVTIGTALGLLVGIITAIKRGTWVDNLLMVVIVFF
jgi:peptide/nickel transport system permease protein